MPEKSILTLVELGNSSMLGPRTGQSDIMRRPDKLSHTRVSSEVEATGKRKRKPLWEDCCSQKVLALCVSIGYLNKAFLSRSAVSERHAAEKPFERSVVSTDLETQL